MRVVCIVLIYEQHTQENLFLWVTDQWGFGSVSASVQFDRNHQYIQYGKLGIPKNIFVDLKGSDQTTRMHWMIQALAACML